MCRRKIPEETKIAVAKACEEEHMSQGKAARKFGVDRAKVCEWVMRYREGGEAALRQRKHRTFFSPEFKTRVVKEYLSGKEGSTYRIAAKYGLCSPNLLCNWIKCYNSGKEFKPETSGGSRMKQGRNTTVEERIAIAKDCLENGSDYGKTAIKFNVSYQQVNTWTKKFREFGEAGLEDRRGKRIASQEPRSEMEEMKIKIAQLEHENYMLRMERDLLKKLDETERSDAFRK